MSYENNEFGDATHGNDSMAERLEMATGAHRSSVMLAYMPIGPTGSCLNLPRLRAIKSSNLGALGCHVAAGWLFAPLRPLLRCRVCTSLRKLVTESFAALIAAFA